MAISFLFFFKLYLPFKLFPPFIFFSIHGCSLTAMLATAAQRLNIAGIRKTTVKLW
jgi:hypothetical protein